ncbi:MAG: sigma-70 family RNA polymerase sigma factor [Firmicutes bacterium]|nr:sigma-70 family RNA polymerase sigma factor [Bacillota bacterium]
MRGRSGENATPEARPHRANRTGATHQAQRTPDDEEALMREYAQTRDPAIRERVVLACTPLVRRVAAEFVFSGVPTEDLVQVGYLGLLNAIAAFDPTRGAKFTTYASYLIRGEIRHYLRDQRDTIRKPRWLQKINARIEDAIGRYLSEEGRFPSLDELATELNIEEEGLLEVLRTREALRTIALESEEDSGELRVDRERIRHRSHVSFQLPIEDRVLLLEAMESLNSLQKKVLYYLFFTDLTQTEAAKRIGISQKHVSRVLASALAKLRGVMGVASSEVI